VAPPLPATTGTVDNLATAYPFIAPARSRDLAPDALRDRALVIYFRVNSTVIDPTRGDNARVLATLVDALRTLDALPGRPRVRVLVDGFASPEGGAELNRRLADGRAAVVRDHLVSRTRLTTADVLARGHGADWRGLRELVDASPMPWRSSVLRVIDTYPVWNARDRVGRLTTLVNLDGGRPYRYMLHNFFPRLMVAFITVSVEE
jgi:hypothetical protein